MNKPAAREDVRVARGQPATVVYRAAVAHARARVDRTTAEVACETMFGAKDPSVILLRAASAPATLTNAAWAGALAAQAVDDSTAAAGQWCAENAPIPVRSQAITAGAVLEPRKLACISVMTSEIAMSSNVEAVVRALLSESAGLALDAAIFSNFAGDATRPPGLLAGVTPITPTAGGGTNAMLTDVKALVAALAAAGGGRNAVIVASAVQAASLSIMAGPHFTVPILASSGLPAGTVVVVESSSFVSGFSAIPEFETSGVVMLHMEDTAPADFPASPQKSMWQTDSFALKMVLRCAWGMRAQGHAQYISGATW